MCIREKIWVIERLLARRDARGQGGFILALVIGLLLVASVMAAVLLSMTSTAAKVQRSTLTTSAKLREVDGALEKSVNSLRTDPAFVGQNCESWGPTTYTTNVSGFSLAATCATTTNTATVRVYDVTVKTGIAASDPVLGRARVKILDTANSRSLPGYSLEVCDWQLGSTITSGALRACS